MSYDINLEQHGREALRWRILRVLDAGRPGRLPESMLHSVLTGADYQVGRRRLRRELKYLRDKELLVIEGEGGPEWTMELTPEGVDVVEYATDAPKGIARPPRDFNV